MIGVLARSGAGLVRQHLLSGQAIKSSSCLVTPQIACYNGVNVVDLDVRPDKRRKKGKSRLKWKYLNKFPPIRKDKEGNIAVDGVSDKAFPCPIPWIEPEVIKRDARHEDGSGDLGSMLDLVGGSVDMSKPRIELEDSKALADAPEEVKRILSLEFANHYNLTAHVKKEMTKKVQDHKMDVDSLAVAIADLTVGIRNDQEQLDEEFQRLGKKNRKRQLSMIGRVNTRRVLLRWLRQKDYKKFEWLLETLNIVYKPRPFIHEEIQRRVHQSRLTALWCDELRTHKMHQYKTALEKEQPAFLREKAEKFRWMMEEEKALGLEVSVSEEEVERLLKKADEIEERISKEESDSENKRQYHIFQPVDKKADKNYFI